MSVEALEAPQRIAQFALEREQVVLPGLDPHQEAVERGDVDAGCVTAVLERLDERRPRAGERIEDMPRMRQVPLEQRLDELWHELPEVRMEPVDVLGPLSLGEVPLRPREVEVQLTVEGVLRGSHECRVQRLLDHSYLLRVELLSAGLESVVDDGQPPRPLGCDVEASLTALDLALGGEPGLGGQADAPLFLRIDHLRRIAQLTARLRLHLAEDDEASPARDYVELIAGGPHVRREDPEPAEAVVPDRATLGPRSNRAGATPR
jgi:hypothetical protein